MRKQPRQGKWLAQRLRSQAATPDSNYLQNTTFLNSVTLWGWTKASLEDEEQRRKGRLARCPKSHEHPVSTLWTGVPQPQPRARPHPLILAEAGESHLSPHSGAQA